MHFVDQQETHMSSSASWGDDDFAHPDEQYLSLLEDILSNGDDKIDRTGVGSTSVFGRMCEFDLREGKLPLLTSKRVHHRAIIHELLWMLKGDTNVKYLIDNNVHIWDSWVDTETAQYDEQGMLMAGEVPHIYGKQWRRYQDTQLVDEKTANRLLDRGYTLKTRYYDIEQYKNVFVVHRTIDQMTNVVNSLKENPDSRRHIVNAWNVGEVDQMGLPVCHPFLQFWTRTLTNEERCVLGSSYHKNPSTLSEEHPLEDHLDDGGVPRYALQAMIVFRSNDMPIGHPFNIVQYALLVHIIARMTHMVPERLVWVGGDVHIYHDQREGVEEQLTRDHHPHTARVHINPNKTYTSLDDFTFDDFLICDYVSEPPLRFPKAAV